VDCRDRKVKPKVITFHRKKNLPYYDISARANYHVIEPLGWLLAKVTGDGGLKVDEVSRLQK
jgi:GTP-binding nuclear protein Ran